MHRRYTTGHFWLDVTCVIAGIYHIAYCLNLAISGEVMTAFTTLIGFIFIGILGIPLMLLVFATAVFKNDLHILLTNPQLIAAGIDILASTVLCCGVYSTSQ